MYLSRHASGRVHTMARSLAEFPSRRKCWGGIVCWGVANVRIHAVPLLCQVRGKYGDDWERISRMSIIEDGPQGEK
jgi:hypothetical protein